MIVDNSTHHNNIGPFVGLYQLSIHVILPVSDDILASSSPSRKLELTAKWEKNAPIWDTLFVNLVVVVYRLLLPDKEQQY